MVSTLLGTLKSLFILLAYLLTGGVFLAFAVPVSLLFLPAKKHKKVFSKLLYGYMRWATRDALKFFGVLDVKEVLGLENVRKNVIIVSNHQSFFDGLLIMGHIPSVPLIKSTYKFNPLFTWIAPLFDFVSIAQPPKSLIDAHKKIRDLLKNGRSVYILPEGTRSLDGKIKKFNPLAFKIAKDENLPVLPIAIYYSRPILSKSSESFVFRKKVDVKIEICPPTRALPNETSAAFSKRVRQAVEKSYLRLSQSPL